MNVIQFNFFPELTKTKNDEYVLIITPDGDEKGIEAKRKLFDNHPKMEK